MAENQDRLDQLFARAKVQPPKTSFNDVKKGLVVGTSIGIFAFIVKWWLGASKLLKIGIMISTITTLTVGTALVLTTTTTNINPTKPEKKIEKPALHETVIVTNELQDNKIEHFEHAKPKIVEIENLPIKTLVTNVLELKVSEIENVGTPIEVKTEKFVVFTITEKSSEDELRKIKQAAEKVGVKVYYKAKYRKSIIKKLTLNLEIKSEDNLKKSNIVLAETDDFEIKIGWVLDNNGKAIDFYNSDDEANLNLIDWSENLTEDLNLDSYINNLMDDMDLDVIENRLEEKIIGLSKLAESNLETNSTETTEKLTDWKKEVENWSEIYFKELDVDKFSKLNEEELELELKQLETELNLLLEKLEVQLKQQ